MKKFFLAFGLLFLLEIPQGALGQEFNCTVTVNYQSLAGSDYSFLQEMKERAAEYVNKRQWTEDRFEEEERIDCTMSIVFTEAISLTRFRAKLILASRRPIYGTAQQTTVLQINDEDLQFEYSQGTPLTYDPDRYHPLTSILNFYAHLMLGFDYDTFDSQGGQTHFEAARRIAEMAQSSSAVGWASLGGDQSRGELIAQVMDPRFRPLRSFYFDYHFGVLDHFVKDPDDARTKLVTLVQGLVSLREEVSRAYYLDQFFSTKYLELANVLRSSPQATQAFDALSKMDPAHLSDYSYMMQ
ncbi:MAG: DUF4835 family protein [Bacteroidetes bacterium]|nr:DUF4835 family protein [Bacteroidota bacterium]